MINVKQKQKKVGIGVICAVVVIVAALSGFLSYAEEKESRGALVSAIGQLAVYAEDITYLQAETKQLFGELPDTPETLSDDLSGNQ